MASEAKTSFEQAMLHAFNYLSFRARSVNEMELYLRRKGHGAETVRDVVQRLIDLHYLDDATFALGWVDGRRRAGGRGPHLLRSELAQKGVARETADRAIADAAGDQAESALAAARRRLPALRAADYPEFSRKVGGYLSRRGFSADVVWGTVKRVWQETQGAQTGTSDDNDDT